jgi:phosphate transport system substrate-binding protein
MRNQLVVCLVILMVLSACYQTAPTINPTLTAFRQPFPRPANTVIVGGSAIVGRVMRNVASGFERFTPGYNIQITESGTKEGFRLFCEDRTDIQMAVRTMSTAESSSCVRNRIHFLQITLAYDALALIGNAPVEDCISISELKFIYTQSSLTWQTIRTKLPTQLVKVYAPPQQTAVEFFNERILQGIKPVKTEPIQKLIAEGNGLGYLPLATVQKLNGRVPLIALDSGSGCTLPTDEAIWDGSYALGRPLYLYINRQSLQRSEVLRFMTFTLSALGQVSIREEEFLPASLQMYKDAQRELDQAREK